MSFEASSQNGGGERREIHCRKRASVHKPRRLASQSDTAGRLVQLVWLE